MAPLLQSPDYYWGQCIQGFNVFVGLFVHLCLFIYVFYVETESQSPAHTLPLANEKRLIVPRPWAESLLPSQGGRDGELYSGDSWKVPKAS